MTFLQLTSVSKSYRTEQGEVRALHDLCLTVARGEFVVLVGPSGCGKSTLLQIVAGLERPSAGQVWLDGRPVIRWGPDRTLIFQKPSLFPWLTACENVAFGLRMARRPSSERSRRAHEMLARMGLAEAARAFPHELSGGMQQRVALARALVLDPAVLLMDEPLASLDSALRTRLQGEIRACCQGRTTLFVTHSVREALILADRLVLLTPSPGQVRREITGLSTAYGPAPRALTPELALLEREIDDGCAWETTPVAPARRAPVPTC
jgi:NitT/TauT family transport system ATP-binding protein